MQITFFFFTHATVCYYSRLQRNFIKWLSVKNRRDRKTYIRSSISQKRVYINDVREIESKVRTEENASEEAARETIRRRKTQAIIIFFADA